MRKVFIAALVVSTLFALTAGRASDESATYVADGGVLTINGGAAGVPVGIGGFGFAAGAKPTAIKLIDNLGGNGVGFTTCQEVLPEETPPGSCGDGNDVSVHNCSTSGFITLEGFKSAAGGASTTWVFVSTADALGGCEGTGTVGTITLRRM
jgi:hypothetical protein